jgi:hypothetical protein
MVQIPAGSILVESMQAAVVAVVGVEAEEAAGGWLHIASNGRPTTAKSKFFIIQVRQNSLAAQDESVAQSTTLTLKTPPDA